MYADTDFLVALIKDDDWLTESAEKVYRENQGEIWTSRYGALELMLISYREIWYCTEVLANIEELVEIKDNTDELLQATVKIGKRRHGTNECNTLSQIKTRLNNLQ